VTGLGKGPAVAVNVKEPCISGKELCITVKEHCINGKELCIAGNELCIPGKELCITVKEPCGVSRAMKAPRITRKETCYDMAQEPCSSRKRAVYHQKEPRSSRERAL
jgi:hypothetical protein